MAVVTTARYGFEVYNGVADESPAPGLQQRQNFTKTIGGFLLTLFADEARCMCPYRMTWNSIEWIKSANHGDGAQEADNFMTDPTDNSAWNNDSPTGGGGQRDGSNFRLGTSHSRMRWSATDGYRHRKNPANWAAPDQDISPPHHTRNPYRLSEVIRDTTIQIGASAAFPWATDNIIIWQTSIVVPALPRFQVTSKVLKLAPISIYSDDTVFDQQEFCDPATGTFSAYAGFPANSNTLSVVTSHSDGTKAIGPYVPVSELGPQGFNSGFHPTGQYDSFIICQTNYPSGVPAGTYTQHGAICWGTRAQYATALQLCKVNLG